MNRGKNLYNREEWAGCPLFFVGVKCKSDTEWACCPPIVKYDGAISHYVDAIQYKDAADRVRDLRYIYGCKLMEEARYEKAMVNRSRQHLISKNIRMDKGDRNG